MIILIDVKSVIMLHTLPHAQDDQYLYCYLNFENLDPYDHFDVFWLPLITLPDQLLH